MGVDRVTLSVPLRWYETNFDSWKVVRLRPRFRERQIRVGGARATLRVNHAGSGPMGSLDFNPSRVYDPDGVSLCPPELVYESARMAFQEASLFVTPEPSIRDTGLARLDLARDFRGVSHGAVLMEGLARAPRAVTPPSLLYFSPRGVALSLTLRNRRGAAILYDKHPQLPDRVPQGMLRFETQCRRDWIRRSGGMAVLGDLTAERVDHLLRDRWDWAGMGATVVSMPRWLEEVGRLHVSPAVRERLVGYLVSQAYGRPAPMSSSTLAKYRRLTSGLGIPDVRNRAPAQLVRLDFDSGREVVE